jgi:hypothetical protein
LTTKKANNYESDFESFEKLLHAIRCDPVINKKVSNLLKKNSYLRRLVLNNWLEQLRRNSAPKKLIQTLSYLFDDSIAEKIYGLINSLKNKRNNHE